MFGVLYYVNYRAILASRLSGLLLGHSEHVYLAAVQPILEFFMRRFLVVFACQVKMQKNIVNLVEQRFV